MLHGEAVATDAGLESCVAMLSNSDTFSSRLLRILCQGDRELTLAGGFSNASVTTLRLPVFQIQNRHGNAQSFRIVCITNDCAYPARLLP